MYGCGDIPELEVRAVRNFQNCIRTVSKMGDRDRGGHYFNITTDYSVGHQLRCMYSGICGPRSVLSVCCPALNGR